VKTLAALAVLVACHRSDPKPFGPRFFSEGLSQRVLCSKGLDKDHEWSHDNLTASLEKARDNKQVLQTFGHAPKLDLAEYVSDFDWAAANGVQMVTYKDLANGFKGAGWAFTVDDNDVDLWYAWRERLRQHHVKATFFVTGYDKLTDPQKQELRDLAHDGHDIEAHGKAHENAIDYMKAHDLDTYLRDEVLPSKTALAEFAPIAFAYPYGAHTTTLDTAMLNHFQLLRTTGAEMCLK
jgi:hypothetical protein